MKWLLSVVIVLLVLGVENRAVAQSLESLVMPGEVIAGHAEIEAECNNCHKLFDRDAQFELCLDCHKDVGEDIEKLRGFHGKSPDTNGVQCASCHTDHEGRQADIVGLREESFDHFLTDFELLGKHDAVECDSCHVDDVPHRKAPQECNSCHNADDVHDGALGSGCADCHSSSSWTEVTFDHDATGFPLLGGHLDADCSGCHQDQTHQNTPTTCFACHANDDIHEGRSGEQCGNCHSPASWSDTSFDHTRDTAFSLLGRHGQLACVDCHSKDPFRDSLQTGCVACHTEDDSHAGHNGSDCAACHSNNDWSEIRFDHQRDTGFVLNGAHQSIVCENCHVEPIFEVSIGDTCESCHVDDDVHEGSQGADCASCHVETSWTSVPFFDHSLTLFPLLGEHHQLECVSCHETQVFADVKSACVSCHVEDDPHKGVFAIDCESCHNPVAWDYWMFDHKAQTSFLLEGAHTEVSCNNCHRRSLAAMKRLGSSCADCHRADDVHDGEFGFDCGRCHDDQSFKNVRSLQ